MKYKVLNKRNKYELTEDLILKTHIYPDMDIHVNFISLLMDGTLTIRSGYRWDGASGPTLDTDNSMSPSCGHDAIFQLMRMGMLDRKWFKVANKDFYLWLRERKMLWIRARVWLRALNKFGLENTFPDENPLIIEVF
tara:strand:- start:130 stop:540 length:411 start_codon:yes stop_codon:yes gene_type:complete